MRRAFLAMFLLCASAASGDPTPRSDPLSITYIANEGLLLQAGDDGVLIDALFRGGVSGYATVEPATLEALETARAPFDKVRAVLVTHHHADHFSAASVARYLGSNAKAVLVTSEQVADSVRDAAGGDAGVLGRIRGFEPQPDKTVTVDANGIKVEFAKLSHGGGRFAGVWNLGYVVHLGGKRILHIGDAHFNNASREPLKRFAVGVDVACIPYWWLLDDDSRTWVTGTLRPKHIVAIHIPPREASDVTRQLRPHLPTATICVTPGKLSMKR